MFWTAVETPCQCPRFRVSLLVSFQIKTRKLSSQTQITAMKTLAAVYKACRSAYGRRDLTMGLGSNHKNGPGPGARRMHQDVGGEGGGAGKPKPKGKPGMPRPATVGHGLRARKHPTPVDGSNPIKAARGCFRLTEMASIAAASGCTHPTTSLKEQMRDNLGEDMYEIIRRAALLVVHRKKKTIEAADIVHVTKTITEEKAMVDVNKLTAVLRSHEIEAEEEQKASRGT